MQNSAKLEAHGISKRYESSLVVNSVTLGIAAGEVVGLVGENGAGKSTLLNILTGIVQPDSGTMVVQGKAFAPSSYAEAARRGVSRVFQEQALIPSLKVYENLLLSHELRFSRFGQILRRRKMIAITQALMDEVGGGIDVRRTTSDYNFSKRQLIEIARACMVPVSVLGIADPIVLLDEPTGSLDRGDEEIFFRLLDRMKRSASFVFVSHRLSEILSVTDKIIVMKDGAVTARLDTRDASEKQLHSLMVGRERDADYYHERAQIAEPGEPIFEVKGLSGSDFFDIDLKLGKGEILGIGGLLYSGKSSLGKALLGVVRPLAGEIRLPSTDWHRPDIQQSLRRGCGYVPAERMVEGIIANFTVAANISLASGTDIFSNACGIWRDRLERETSQNMIKRLNIRGGGPATLCRNLSGGNQQKVVIARWLCRDLTTLILDNPTRGVDAGAKEEIYVLIRDLAEAGVGIVLITDELLELIGLSNRIVIMQRGRLTSAIDAPVGSKPSEIELIGLMLPSASDHG